MTIRERITEETKNAKNQVDLDRIWHGGFPQRLIAEFPNASPSEIMYEWDSRKMQIKKMV